MLRLWSRLRSTARHTPARKVVHPRYDVDFYASSWIDELWIRSTLIACTALGYKCRLIISSDPNNWPWEMISFYQTQGCPIVHAPTEPILCELGCRVVVTATSGIPRRYFGQSLCHLIHMPHSLVSLHMVYPEGAFDDYDAIFCCGPHHDREIRAIASLRGFKEPATYAVGYGKFDLFKTEKHENQNNKRVLLAPSWGDNNILSVMGVELVSGLLDNGYEVYLRPHPSFFYYKDKTINNLRAAFTERQLVLEDSTVMPAQSWGASVLISDYSGVALEYAANRRRPIVFVDVAKKVLNPNWQMIGLKPVEVEVRAELGIIASPTPLDIIRSMEMLAGRENLSDASISRFCYSPTGAATRAAQTLAEIYIKPD